ncbi:MAG: cytochrome C biogenesis protein [Xanthobacteraceae bacterium]|nr:cytochrome C biogenesis protein [Xanthobacteraceae bacterium]
MSERPRTAFLAFFVALAGLPVVAAAPAIAADASRWDDGLQSSVRLIAARTKGEGAERIHRAGIEFKLAAGWKTYWRHPGDSGVPPSFDFSKSDNVKSAAVLFPAPARFPDGAGGSSIGYKRPLVLPVHIVPNDPAKPVLLRLKLDYAVCEKLCVPAEANVELKLTGTDKANDAVVGAAEALVPKASAVGDSGPFAIRAVHRASGPKSKILVDVAAPVGATPVLFAEGPTALWALPLPEPVAGAPAGLQRFAFVLDGLPPGESGKGATLRLTLVADDNAIEAGYRLD